MPGLPHPSGADLFPPGLGQPLAQKLPLPGTTQGTPLPCYTPTMFPPQGPHRPWAWVFLRDAPLPQPSPCPLMSVPATPSVLESLDGMCPLVPGPGSRAPPLSLLTSTSLTTGLYGFSTFLGSPSNPVPFPSPRLWVSPLFPPQLWGSPNPDGPWACPLHHVTNGLCNPAPSPDPPRGDFRGGLCSVPAAPLPPPPGGWAKV